MPALSTYWGRVIVDTATRLGFEVNGTRLTLHGQHYRVVFFVEHNHDGLTVHQKGHLEPRHLMDELDCLDFCQWLRRFTRRFKRLESKERASNTSHDSPEYLLLNYH